MSIIKQFIARVISEMADYQDFDEIPLAVAKAFADLSLEYAFDEEDIEFGEDFIRIYLFKTPATRDDVAEFDSVMRETVGWTRLRPNAWLTRPYKEESFTDRLTNKNANNDDGDHAERALIRLLPTGHVEIRPTEAPH